MSISATECSSDEESTPDNFRSLDTGGTATKSCVPDFNTWFDTVARLENTPDNFRSLDTGGTATKSCVPDFNTWFDTVARLEKKAEGKTEKGDITGALKLQDRVVDICRDSLSRKQDDNRPRTRESEDLAKALVNLARLQSIVGVNDLAMVSYREAMTLYQSSDAPQNADRILEIEAEQSRIGSPVSSGMGDRTLLDRMIDTQHRPIKKKQTATFFRM